MQMRALLTNAGFESDVFALCARMPAANKADWLQRMHEKGVWVQSAC